MCVISFKNSLFLIHSMKMFRIKIPMQCFGEKPTIFWRRRIWIMSCAVDKLWSEMKLLSNLLLFKHHYKLWLVHGALFFFDIGLPSTIQALDQGLPPEPARPLKNKSKVTQDHQVLSMFSICCGRSLGFLKPQARRRSSIWFAGSQERAVPCFQIIVSALTWSVTTRWTKSHFDIDPCCPPEISI